MTTVTTTPIEPDALTARTKAPWMAGDFGKIAQSYAPGAAEFINTLHFQPSERVLDVACGTGNLAIPAARTGAHVTGIDIAPNLLEQAQAWARAEGLMIGFEEGDAEEVRCCRPDGVGDQTKGGCAKKVMSKPMMMMRGRWGATTCAYTMTGMRWTSSKYSLRVGTDDGDNDEVVQG